MADDDLTAGPRKLLARLQRSLDDLDGTLAPLLSVPLSETAATLDPLERAKLHVLVPYVAHDLIFIYLKTRGIDPKTHPVVAELERVKQYFAKIKRAEDPEKRRFAVDRGAAERFIKHAISQVEAMDSETPETPDEQPETETSTGAKRKREAIDPFAGYDNLAAKPSKKQRQAPAFKYVGSGAAPSESAPQSSASDEEQDEEQEADETVLGVATGGLVEDVRDPEDEAANGEWTRVEKKQKPPKPAKPEDKKRKRRKSKRKDSA